MSPRHSPWRHPAAQGAGVGKHQHTWQHGCKGCACLVQQAGAAKVRQCCGRRRVGKQLQAGGSAGGGSSAARVQPATGSAGGAPEGGACGGGCSSGPHLGRAPRLGLPLSHAHGAWSDLSKPGCSQWWLVGEQGSGGAACWQGVGSAATQMPVHCITRPAAGPAAPALATHA